jgi:hypothetical protein
MQTWRDHGYRVHLMTGVAWGQYQDYLYGRFDGVNHEDEEQTNRRGQPHRHGNSTDIFYMCPGTNYGKYLCVGVQRALEAGAEAMHLEEPEFWVEDGYEAAFKREWRSYYGQDWEAPHSSEDAQWRASKLKYFLYRRALQQVFDFVQDFNRRTGKTVRCYVPTHSLLNYAQWRIVSPESSLARLNGCDGYIAQVWTGTSRTPNFYRGEFKERTFETAFLEYGAMQNLVRATGRRVWYLNDPIEDNPNHDWEDYRRNWESTLVASLFQPEVWRYEVAPWPERVFTGRYPRRAADRKGIPPTYATELQTVMNALNDMNQSRIEWDCGTSGLGVIISDSLMFERGDPNPSDLHLGHIYGLAMPLVKRGMPVTPVQLENLTVPHCLDGFRLLTLTYRGQKPLSPDIHRSLADWVKNGGALVVVDDDGDPFNRVREWWNSNGMTYTTPRQHLFEQLELPATSVNDAQSGTIMRHGKGCVVWFRENPAKLAADSHGDETLIKQIQAAAGAIHLDWHEANHLLLRRGPYLIAAGLDESIGGEPKLLHGRFVNLFDSELHVQETVSLTPGSRFFLLDLNAIKPGSPQVLASACKSLTLKREAQSLSLQIDGVADTPAAVMVDTGKQSSPPRVTLAGAPCSDFRYSAAEHLLWVTFPNEAKQRNLEVTFSAN